MKTKSFKDYLEKRLDKAEIAEIENAAELEYHALKSLQEDVSKAVIAYMSKNDIGFNELVNKLDKSPSQVSRIIKGDANLTLATIAHIFATIKQRPHLTYTEASS